MEEEWNFIIPNDSERKRYLGLDFMIEDGDENKNATEPVNIAKEDNSRKYIFDQGQFEKLCSNSSKETMETFQILDNYVMSLDGNIKKITTTVYLAYALNNNFIELFFQNDTLKFILKNGEYNDSKNKVYKLNDSYNWTNTNAMTVNNDDDLDYIKDILKQCYDKVK